MLSTELLRRQAFIVLMMLAEQSKDRSRVWTPDRLRRHTAAEPLKRGWLQRKELGSLDWTQIAVLLSWKWAVAQTS